MSAEFFEPETGSLVAGPHPPSDQLAALVRLPAAGASLSSLTAGLVAPVPEPRLLYARPKLVEARRVPLRFLVAKRTLDVLVAVGLLLLTAPFLVGAMLAILVFDRQNPVFPDSRVGRAGRQFRCLKLRTMKSDPSVLDRYLAAHPYEADSYELTRKLSRDPRITRVGSILRKSSLDELPQLLNVLAGQMSIVGPRPICLREFELRDGTSSPLILVRPGLTGLWQVRGRSDLSHRRRVVLDNFYATHWSPWFDVKLMVRTPLAILQARGAK